MKPTPLTDAQSRPFSTVEVNMPHPDFELVPAAFARELELELDEAIESHESSKLTFRATCDHFQRELSSTIKQRNALALECSELQAQIRVLTGCNP